MYCVSSIYLFSIFNGRIPQLLSAPGGERGFYLSPSLFSPRISSGYYPPSLSDEWLPSHPPLEEWPPPTTKSGHPLYIGVASVHGVQTPISPQVFTKDSRPPPFPTSALLNCLPWFNTSIRLSYIAVEGQLRSTILTHLKSNQLAQIDTTDTT